METVGKLFRETVQGTLDLLRARTLTKSEMHVDTTSIRPTENNPLKFSPTAEAALAHLLDPRVPGYLPPLRAVKDAYDDLRAHQFGVLAGMRAALDGVLACFEPQRLEERLAEPGVLAQVLTSHRKAKLWELFIEHYADVVGEAKDDFSAAFGKAFAQAYEAQVKKLRTEGRSG